MKSILTFFIVMITLTVVGQYIPNQKKFGNIDIHASGSIDALMQKQKLINKKTSEVDGFRIQITFSNDRSKVYSSKANFYKRFPDKRSYVLYEQPYFKLRVGDFQTKLEAHRHLNQIVHHFPDAFVVLDRIKVN